MVTNGTSDDKFGVDVWEVQPGQVPFADLGYDELFYILEGSISMTGTDGNEQTYAAGEGVILPSGWSGTARIPDNGARMVLMWHLNKSGD